MTNGSVAISEGCLWRARLGGHVARAMDVTAVQRWKPAGAVYAHAASELGYAPEQARAAPVLLAAHPWEDTWTLVVSCAEQCVS